MTSSLKQIIDTIGKFEFLTEQVFPYVAKEDKDQQKLISVLLLFEMVKVPMKLQRYFQLQKDQIQISDENIYQKIEQMYQDNQQLIEERFTAENWAVLKQCDNNQQMVEKLKNLLDSIKSKKLHNFEFQNKDFNQKTEELQKDTGIISTLPIPKELQLVQQAKKPFNKKKNMLIIVSELLYIVRPFIYCFFLKIYGIKCYRPYLISLFVDLLRQLALTKIKTSSKKELEERKSRNRDMLFSYLMRNPFYSQIMKEKVIQPFLTKIFGSKFMAFQNFILQIIEWRCALSLQM